MERYNEKEYQKKYRGEIKNMFTNLDGTISFNVSLQDRNHENDTISLQLPLYLQKKLDIVGRLSEGMDIVITFDMDGYVEKIERILH